VHCRLEGRLVTLVGLDVGEHSDALYREVGGEAGDGLWQYMVEGPYRDRPSFDAALRAKSTSQDPLFLAIVDRASNEARGYAAYMRIEPAHRVIEIGNVVFARRLQRTAAATEAMYLMARHAFDTLGYRRYEWKCDALNEPSRRAAVRLGFTFEGLFRQHLIVKGHSRDTAWYSIIDAEWPRCRQALETWLAPDNFDADGGQRRRLSDIRAEKSRRE
jgi:RimJ/RimL family protein N-acetyltransferase